MNSSKPEQGFVLPIAIGVGLIAILLGIMVVTRSNQNRVTATAQRETARSLAAAETGITQFQSLLDRYRPLATYCSISPAAPSSCGSTDWSNIMNSALPDSNFCSPIPPVNAATLAKGYVGSTWKNVSNDPDDTEEIKIQKGQFRLISYLYKSDSVDGSSVLPGLGELTVEGRVNQNSDNTSSNRTSTTRLNVQFRVESRSIPGLWIMDEDASSTDATTLNTSIQNSTCLTDPAAVSKFATVSESPNKYVGSPGVSFPALPQQGIDIAGFGTSTRISAINDPASSLTAPSGTSTVKYDVEENSGLSINLTSSSLTVGTDSNPATYFLYLKGGISVSAGRKIQVANGSKLIIYAHGPITLAGDSTTVPITQAGTSSSENVQIYLYAAGSPGPTVNISGGNSAMNLFLFAPASQVIMNSGSQVKGMIWAQSWVGSGGAEVIQSITDARILNGIQLPRISPITSWQRQAVNP